LKTGRITPPAERRFDWKIPDPIGHSDAVFREVRDLIRDHIRKMLEEMKIPANAPLKTT
jgi:protein-tyrosine-phosphatase